ncbi:MAG TPA: hypothetical protein VKV25_01240 [Acidimicrobiales bacterium]|nr:hypothetical protein [Acidimicrobiales bacterium]
MWAVGFSNGGRMAYRLACDLPGVLAGFAAVEAVPAIDCARLRPLDVEIIAQRHDRYLTIRNGLARKSMEGWVEPTVQATVRTWRRLDGCGPRPVVRHGTATVKTWACADGTRLQYALYSGGGHRWPPDATPLIARLFATPRLRRV